MIENLQDLLNLYGCESPGSLGRTFHENVDCGPWTGFLVDRDSTGRREDFQEIPCSDRSAWTDWESWAGQCGGVRVGSLVDGSEAEAQPGELLFPFTSQQMEEVLASVNEEAEYYWRRDNLAHFLLLRDIETYAFDYGWGEPDVKEIERLGLTPEHLEWLEEQYKKPFATDDGGWMGFADGTSLRQVVQEEPYHV